MKTPIVAVALILGGILPLFSQTESVTKVPGGSSTPAGKGYLAIHSEPTSASVFIGGVFRGVTPLFAECDASDSILVTKQFCQPWRTVVNLRPGDTLSITAYPYRMDARLSILVSEPGEVVFIDGVSLSSGTLRDYVVQSGVHDILVKDTLTGRFARKSLTIGDGQEQHYEAALGYHSLWRLAGSAVIPGFAPIADHDYLEGTGIFVLSVAAIAFTVHAGNAYADRLGDYNTSVASYAAAPTEQDALIRREIMFRRHDELNSSYRTRTASFVALGLVYAFNLFTTVLNHMVVDEIRYLPGGADLKFVASAGETALMLRAELTLP
jgi:hypothetical protein